MTAVPKPWVPKLSNAFVTARKGLCYLTIRQFGRNQGMMRIRADQHGLPRTCCTNPSRVRFAGHR